MWKSSPATNVLPNFSDMDLTGKKVALYGLGDQVSYSNEFVDALGELYDYVANCGAESLVLDKDNQASLTEQRIAGWVEQISAEMNL